jgi:hypothetical protein
MPGLSDVFEANVLNALLRNIALQVAAVHVGLNVSDPSDVANPTEMVDTSYARQLTTFSAPSGAGTTANSGDITYTALAGPSSVTVTHVSFWTAPSGGQMIMSQALNASKTFSVGDVPRFPAGALTVTAT